MKVVGSRAAGGSPQIWYAAQFPVIRRWYGAEYSGHAPICNNRTAIDPSGGPLPASRACGYYARLSFCLSMKRP